MLVVERMEELSSGSSFNPLRELLVLPDILLPSPTSFSRLAAEAVGDLNELLTLVYDSSCCCCCCCCCCCVLLPTSNSGDLGESSSNVRTDEACLLALEGESGVVVSAILLLLLNVDLYDDDDDGGDDARKPNFVSSSSLFRLSSISADDSRQA